MGYYFTNVLDITTSSLSLDYINPKKKRLDLIKKLHKEGKNNKEIVKILKLKRIKKEIRMMTILPKMYLYVLRS